MKIIYEFSDEEIVKVHDLYKQAWWSKNRTLIDTISCIRGSQICIGIFDDNEALIGFARVLSDFIYKALIFDVIVAPNEQGKGVGKKLIEQLKSHNKLSQVKHFELYCLPEMEGFYRSLGFSAEVGGIRLLRCENA
ncbi:GNAT family N-acetyltransferase [uncultured Vibrio sp.]|uniref:GNAT family N-acetyltransferase n=1 Tax=uncultured Vibrio sp. TaxID=114054 RepID=UPI000920E476|nr:GNAT family N-acetyltransferase [uncultured Vibrio sp.]OIQ26531.1 MAG: GNAT family N-acetyltransferase [Vibrio sp. MedPE-SWchi]